MSSFIVMPLWFWDCPLKTITTASASSGSIYNAINSQRPDYLGLSGGGEMDIEGNAAFSLPSYFANSESAVYMKISDDVLSDPNTDFFEWGFYSGATSGTLTQRTLANTYGNCKVDGDYFSTNEDSTDGGTVSGYAVCCATYDDQYVDAYQRIISNGTGSPASSPKIYDFMIGHVLGVPDGFVRRERQVQRTFYGGKVGTTRFGNPTWSGIFSSGHRSRFDIVMGSLRSDERDRWRWFFRYGRGVLPFLFVEDSTDCATWKKCIAKRFEEVEDSGEYSVTVEMEQV